MAYERETIAESVSAIPTQSQPEMREERVINPYAVKTPRVPLTTPPPAKVGQPDISTSENPEAPKGEPAESVTLAPAAAALARKEQKFRQMELALKEKEKTLEAERAEIADLKAMKARLAAKDFSDIEKAVPYDEFTNYLIQKESASDPAKVELNEIRKELAEVKQSQKSDVDKRYEAAVNERRKAVTTLVGADESFSGMRDVKMRGSDGKEIPFSEAVVQHILDTWEKDSIDLEPSQAAKEVKEIFQEVASQWAKYAPKNEAVTTPAEKTLPPLKTGIKTLTNNVTLTGDIKRPAKSFQGMSQDERYAEARRRAQEKLGIK